MARDAGFYWVRWGGDWIVALFCISDYVGEEDFWMLPGENDEYADRDFEEIDDRKINRKGAAHD